VSFELKHKLPERVHGRVREQRAVATQDDGTDDGMKTWTRSWTGTQYPPAAPGWAKRGFGSAQTARARTQASGPVINELHAAPEG